MRARVWSLRGMPLDTLFLANTRVGSLEPIRGAPLKRVNVSASKVSDVAPLAEFPDLEEIRLPTGLRNIERLRALPTVGTCRPTARTKPPRNSGRSTTKRTPPLRNKRRRNKSHSPRGVVLSEVEGPRRTTSDDLWWSDGSGGLISPSPSISPMGVFLQRPEGIFTSG